ncbi:hypothetical protein DL95DRAFT_399397 [Leptodontidium sp. 2 PMI_412]|nr:hypothetical protein DL95DRAFT_399397 [Leptodontidium sp. 2 PMI_412]
MNTTITVPEGTSNHGDPNLLCTPTKWYQVLLFFLVNYVSHAVTVKALPGERTSDVFWSILCALFYPYSGINRGLEAIVRHAAWRSGNALQRAAHAGALCVVVRSEEWTPKNGERINNVKINTTPSTRRGLALGHRESMEMAQRNPVNADESASLHVFVPAELKEGFNNPIFRTRRKVHGARDLAREYTLAILPSNTTIRPIVGGDHGDIAISSSYNIPKVIVSIVQVFFASITLYRSRGDQLSRYGYAAFGLTVLPYIVMSIVNLVGNLLTPDYPTLYLVRSPEMEEAEARELYFDGIIGTVTEESSDGNESTDGVTCIVEGTALRTVHTGSEGPFSSAPSSPGPVPEINTGVAGPSTTVTALCRQDRGDTAGSQEEIRQHSAADRPNVAAGTVYRLRRQDQRNREIRIPVCSNFQRHGSRPWGEGRAYGLFLFTLYVLGAIPYAVIGILTHFDSAQSTIAQRVWTMSWLAFGVVWGTIIPFITSEESMIKMIYPHGPDGLYGTENIFFKWWLTLFYSPFAIGGFVVVGQMLNAYGSCIRLS